MIAVLISGAIRNLSETWPENKILLDQLNQPYEVYVHSWTRNFGTPRKVYKDRTKSGFSVNFREFRYDEEDFDVTEAYIGSIIPKSHIQLQEFHEDEVVLKYGLSEHADHILFRNLVNSVAMYEGISRVFKNAISEGPRKYSNFVRLRTDFVLSSPIPLESLECDIYFGGPGVDPGFGFVSDQFFIVRPEIASTFARCEDDLLRIVIENGWGLDSPFPLYGERILSRLLREIRLDKKVILGPAIGAIRRPPTVPVANSFSIAHIQEVANFNLRVLSNKVRGILAWLKDFVSLRNR